MSNFILSARGSGLFYRLTHGFSERFQRSRIWSPGSVMMWLLVLTMPNRKNTYRSSLRTMGIVGRRYFGWAKTPSLASIAQARDKLSVPMCRDLLRHVSESVESRCPSRKLFSGRRVIAFDGTRLITQRSKDTVQSLFRHKKADGTLTHYPQGMMVMALDVERRMPLDWVLTGELGETKALEKLLDTIAIQPGDIAVLDRGYTSKKLYALLQDRGIDVVIRLRCEGKTAWDEVKSFSKTKSKDTMITINFRRKKDQDPLPQIRARLVERNKKPGPAKKGTKKERMVLLTSLKPEDGFDRNALLKLYKARWGVETAFRELKSFLDIEPFHGKTVQFCEQEIAASLIWMALATYLQVQAEDRMEKRRVYRTDCLRYAADRLHQILANSATLVHLEDDIDALIRHSSYADKQSERSYPRECKMPYGRSVQRGAAK